MANNTSDRGSRNGAPERPGWSVREAAKEQTLRERFGALRNLPPFFALIWKTSRALTIASLSIRIVRAVLPVIALYVGKLIIDTVLAVTKVSP
ncbi:MAG: ABC transporter ATP-binding protein, partial [Dokdonella sp.]